MLDRLIKSFSAIPEHLISVGMIVTGAVIAVLPHLTHTYETGSALMASGLTMYRGKQAAE